MSTHPIFAALCATALLTLAPAARAADDLVVVDRQVKEVQTKPTRTGLCHGVTVLAWARVDGTSLASSSGSTGGASIDASMIAFVEVDGAPVDAARVGVRLDPTADALAAGVDVQIEFAEVEVEPGQTVAVRVVPAEGSAGELDRSNDRLAAR